MLIFWPYIKDPPKDSPEKPPGFVCTSKNCCACKNFQWVWWKGWKEGKQISAIIWVSNFCPTPKLWEDRKLWNISLVGMQIANPIQMGQFYWTRVMLKGPPKLEPSHYRNWPIAVFQMPIRDLILKNLGWSMIIAHVTWHLIVVGTLVTQP